MNAPSAWCRSLSTKYHAPWQGMYENPSIQQYTQTICVFYCDIQDSKSIYIYIYMYSIYNIYIYNWFLFDSVLSTSDLESSEHVTNHLPVGQSCILCCRLPPKLLEAEFADHGRHVDRVPWIVLFIPGSDLRTFMEKTYIYNYIFIYTYLV